MTKKGVQSAAISEAEMTDFGRRAWEQLQGLGYATRGEVVRAASVFRRDLYPDGSKEWLRDTLRGGRPSYQSVELLEALGVDLHYCRYGTRGDRPRITAADGFDWGQIAARFGDRSDLSLSVLWRAPETLHMAKACPRDTAVSLGTALRAFGECMRLRSLQSGVRPVRVWTFSDQSTFRPVATDGEMATLATWFSVWARDFAVPVEINAGVLAGLEGVAFSLSCIQPAARWISQAA
jgi:hypothetical protein